MASDEPPTEQLPRHLKFFISDRHGSAIRPVLLLGFAIVFGLWLLSTYALVQRVTEAERQAAAITTRFSDSEELLYTVRAQVLLSSVYARDAILETVPDVASSYRNQFRTIRDDVERALARYLPDIDSNAEREHWTHLHDELRQYWVSVAPVLTGQMAGDSADARAFLRREVIPQRDRVVRISEDLRTLNQDALQQQQAAVGQLHARLRQRIWWTSGIAVVFGLAIAFVAARYAGLLESRLRAQHLQERQHTYDLQRLSAELVHAQENERRTIGRDLHDEIGQALMTIKLDLGAIDRSGQLSGAAARALGEAQSTTAAAVQSVRDLSQLLHPAMLDEFGLAVTLEAYVRSFAQRTGLQAELVQDRMDVRIASELEICVYRVVQEALTNVAKHAGATSCRVYLHRLPYSVLATVEDDGKGIDREGLEITHDAAGVGLLGIRERVSRLAGTFRLDSHLGKGTRLTIELPVPSAESGMPQLSPRPAYAPVVSPEST
jgi:signal transduction histidine kinase